MPKSKLRNRIFATFIAAACVAVAAGATACGGNEPSAPPAPPVEKTLTGISFAYTTERSYALGDTVTEENNAVLLKYNTGETERIAMNAEGVTLTADAETTGPHTGKLSYKDFEASFTYSVYDTLEDTVSVTGGEIAGCVTDDKAVEMYKGIPYAAPPVDDLRWHAPQDVKPWEDVLECYRYGAGAMQTVPDIGDYSPVPQVSEDCLTLNVWTNGRQSAEKPVIVYIHGSDNASGGTSAPAYDGEKIAREDVVFVSVNYRLGIYGFFSCAELAEEEDGCGNFALLDQIKALEWVQDNIGAFGGDKTNVTVVGQGMGGMNVEALLCSPLAEGLFCNAAVLSSGMYFLQDLPTLEQSYYDVGALTLEELRAMPDGVLATFENNGVFSPVYDGYVLTEPTLRGALAKDAGNSKSVNVLVGLSTTTVSLYADLRLSPSSTGPKATSDAALAQRNLFVNARLKGGATGSNYLYYFGYGNDTLFWLGNNAVYGTKKSTDAAVAAMCMSYLVHFAKTGNPNGKNLSTQAALPEWNVSTGDYSYLYLQGTENEYLTMMGPSVGDFESLYSEFSEFFPA